ncbi:MAG TPA: hypothetical protein VJL84_08920 [Kiloniellales bacterium]|nr:hypothetical protein [Kiloniellales bacterium]
MNERLSAPATQEETSRAPVERAKPVQSPSPTGPTGGYAAITIGRWWHGRRAASFG